SVRYHGSLTGHYNVFIANGTLETELGTVHTDVHLDLTDRRSYTGKLSADTFDIGTLLGYNEVGTSSFDIAVDGSGFAAHDINGTVSGHVNYLEFNTYRYTDMEIQGRFADMLFAGKLDVADPNLQLAFDGEANFNPRNPSYRFSTKINHANLKELRLYEKKPLVIPEAAIASDFTGNSLNTIQGSIGINNVRFQVDTAQYTVDSLTLLAKGDSEHRVLSLTSDIADATLTGEMDLNTLGSYFKSVAMRYAPAMGLTAQTPGKQAFHVDLTLKDFTPISPFVAPNLA